MASTLSIFMPAYNEAGNIESTVVNADKALKELDLKKYEIIVVNDGSKDNTKEIVERLKKKIPNLVLVNHETNLGYGAGVTTGFKTSRYELVGFIDSDGQFDLSEITKLLDLIKTCDVVTGYRLDRQDPLIRKINGWGWTFLANLLLGLNVRDVDCAFKLFKREVVDAVLPLEATRGGMISPEVLAKAHKKGFKIREVGVHHYERKEGEQTGADLKVILNSFKDLFILWWKINFA